MRRYHLLVFSGSAKSLMPSDHACCSAEAMFRKAIEIEPHESSYQQLGKVLVMREDITGALATFHQALDQTPESSDTLCQIGLLHLRQGEAPCALRLHKQGKRG